MPFQSIKDLLSVPIYDHKCPEKQKLLLKLLRQICTHHYKNCPQYRMLCKKKDFNPQQFKTLEEIPFLPTDIFKDTLLLSIPENEVFREIQSSATTSGRPSRMGINKENNQLLTKSLQRILLQRVGNKRHNTMILDDESVLGRGKVVSARASMTKTLLFLSSKVSTCLVSDSEALRLEKNKLTKYFDQAGDGEGHLLFGFTFVLYKYVVQPLLASGTTFRLPKLKVIHAGGWKKLQDQKVSEEELIKNCCRCFGVLPENIIDLYGFSEQSGLLYPTCEYGLRHTPLWSAVICRDPLSLKPLPEKVEGLMQFITPIQISYPGHSVLTEDIGMIIGQDKCDCGRNGTAFKVVGRSNYASEERGCGDIMSHYFN